jgi:mono/diheme cytochrome c family protein
MNGYVWAALAIPFATALAGQSMMDQGVMGQHRMMGAMMNGSMARHNQAMMSGVPHPYRTLKNPLRESTSTLHRGALVYEQNCAACHGARGYGNGPAGQQLRPQPANLAMLEHMPTGRSDGYLYWTIAEGGKQLDTAMPAFKATLGRSDIWAVIAYIQNGLPAGTSK